MYIYLCIDTYICVYKCVHVNVGANGQLQVSFLMTMLPFFEIEYLTELGSKIKLDCMTTESQESSCLCLPRFESANSGLSCTTS